MLDISDLPAHWYVTEKGFARTDGLVVEFDSGVFVASHDDNRWSAEEMRAVWRVLVPDRDPGDDAIERAIQFGLGIVVPTFAGPRESLVQRVDAAVKFRNALPPTDERTTYARIAALEAAVALLRRAHEALARSYYDKTNELLVVEGEIAEHFGYARTCSGCGRSASGDEPVAHADDCPEGNPR